MCVAAIAWNAHPRWLLVVAANRDEFHERPAAPLSRWGNGVIAGQDLRGGGTWMGLSESGRFTLVTNFRVPGYPLPERPSRGGLVSGLLTGECDPASVTIARYNPFNLFHADGPTAHVLSNHPQDSRQCVNPGIHGLSNGDYAAPWPKTRQICGDLAQWLELDASDPEPLMAALRRESPDEVTPHGPEPRLSGVFIRDPVYGTRCSSVVMLGREGLGRIIERRFDSTGAVAGQSEEIVRWSPDRLTPRAQD